MSSTALHSHDGVGRSVTIDFNKEAPTRSTAKAMSFTPSLQTICDELLVEVCFCPGRGGACGACSRSNFGPLRLPLIPGQISSPGQILGQIPRKNLI